MASKSSIKWNDAAFHEILNSIEVEAFCDQQAARVARAAGPEFYPKHWHSNMKGGRAASLVLCTWEGRKIEAETKALTKAAHQCTIYYQ
jgi:hypothetical protein